MIEHLTTPYAALSNPAKAGEPFTTAAGIAEAIGYIAEAPDFDAARLEVAAYVQEQVKATLYYPEDPKDSRKQPNETTLDTVIAYQEANCIGHTYIGSEALSAIGIEHYIAYVNGHFMTLVAATDAEGAPRLRSFDMLSPKLNQDITGAISFGNPGTILQALGERPDQPHDVMLHTDRLAANLGKDIYTLSAIHPWLGVRNESRWGQEDAKLRNSDAAGNQFRCVMSVYTAEAGREVVEQYAAFRRDVAIGATACALVQLAGLSNRYPEVDCRAPHPEIRSLVGALCNAGQLTEAVSAIDMYCSRLTTTGDPRGQELRGDLLRQVGNQGNDQAGHAAIAAYQRASRLSRIPSYSLACLNKASQIQAGLAA